MLATLLALASFVLARPVHAVIGGGEAPPNAYPWLVRIEHTVFKNPAIASHRLNPNDSWTMTCGGTLIDERWVLTAAHCIEEAGWGNKNLPLGLRAVLGDHVIKPDGIEEPGVQVSPVSEIVVYPDYGPDRNDVALLRLAERVVNSAKVAPIRLADASEVRVGSAITVAGWGLPQDGGRASSVVRHGGGSVVVMDKTQLATDGGALSGFGDSGGPLMVRVNGQLKLAGVVSTRNGYTLVPAFADWIAATRNETRPDASGDNPSDWLNGGYGARPSQTQLKLGNRTYDFRCDHGGVREFARCWTRVTERTPRGAELRTPWMGRNMLQARAANANLQFGNISIDELHLNRRGNVVIQGYSAYDFVGIRGLQVQSENQLASDHGWIVIERGQMIFLLGLFGIRM